MEKMEKFKEWVAEVKWIAAVKVFLVKFRDGVQDAWAIIGNMRMVRESKKTGKKVVIQISPQLYKDLLAMSNDDMVRLAAMLTANTEFYDKVFGSSVREILAFEHPDIDVVKGRKKAVKKALNMSVTDIRSRKRK